MGKMKISMQCGRVDSAGRHNDRNFDLKSAPHIDPDRIKNNKYYTYNGDLSRSFLELETEYYKEHFSAYLEQQKEKNEKIRHPERNRTALQYYKTRRTQPQDVILQIGNREEHATADELWDCAMAYKDKFNDLFGENCIILDMALHDDEDTPHVHIRRVWKYTDENDIESVSQRKALEQLSIGRPNLSKSDTKENNPTVAFTALDREMFIQICEERGFDIDRSPSEKRHHLKTERFKENKQIETINRHILRALEWAEHFSPFPDDLKRKIREKRENGTILDDDRLITETLELFGRILEDSNAMIEAGNISEKSLSSHDEYEDFFSDVSDKKDNDKNEKTGSNIEEKYSDFF